MAREKHAEAAKTESVRTDPRVGLAFHSIVAL